MLRVAVKSFIMHAYSPSLLSHSQFLHRRCCGIPNNCLFYAYMIFIIIEAIKEIHLISYGLNTWDILKVYTINKFLNPYDKSVNACIFYLLNLIVNNCITDTRMSELKPTLAMTLAMTL